MELSVNSCLNCGAEIPIEYVERSRELRLTWKEKVEAEFGKATSADIREWGKIRCPNCGADLRL